MKKRTDIKNDKKKLSLSRETIRLLDSTDAKVLAGAGPKTLNGCPA
jgi:hypothetical protein